MRVGWAMAVVQAIVRVVIAAAGAMHMDRVVILCVRMIMAVVMRVAVPMRMVMRVVMCMTMCVDMTMVVRMVVRMCMHGAIGMPVHGTAVDLRFAFAATAYRAHAVLLRQPSGQLDVLDPQLVAAGHLQLMAAAARAAIAALRQRDRFRALHAPRLAR